MTAGGLLSLLGALVATLGVLGLAVKMLRRLQAGPSGAARGPMLQVLQRMPLGPRQGVALLRVGERVLVVSVAESEVRLLTELDESERAAALAVPARRPTPLPPPLALLSRLGLLAVLAVVPTIARAQAPISSTSSVASTPATPDSARSVARRIRPISTSSPPPAATAAPRAPAPRLPSLGVRGPVAPQVDIRLGEGNDQLHLSGAVGLVVFMGVLTLLPAMFLLMTSFTRILIVLHFLRSALGTQTTPPSQLLAAMAVLLTGVVMNPVLQETHRVALQPYFDGQITQVEAYQRGVKPFREFMVAHTREQDLNLFTELSGVEGAQSIDDVPTVTVVSAFMTSELRTAFQMGFVIYLPFVVVDVIVASVLMSLGMFMLPPAMVSLPFKLLLFVLADGWTLVVQNLVTSFR